MRVQNLWQKKKTCTETFSSSFVWTLVVPLQRLILSKGKAKKRSWKKKHIKTKYRCRLHTFIFPKLPPEASYPVKTLRFSSSSSSRGVVDFFPRISSNSNICFSQFLKKSGMKRALEKHEFFSSGNFGTTSIKSWNWITKNHEALSKYPWHIGFVHALQVERMLESLLLKVQCKFSLPASPDISEVFFSFFCFHHKFKIQRLVMWRLLHSSKSKD